MATFQFELVSPAKLLFSGPVDQVDVPGTEGDFGVLAGHAPLIASIRPGVVTVWRSAGPTQFALRRGIAEVASDTLTVMAEHAVAVDDIDAAMLAEALLDARQDLIDAKDDRARADAQERIDQLTLLRDARSHAAETEPYQRSR
jgi:F-type H+-transporting ATPase subunit epsilon